MRRPTLLLLGTLALAACVQPEDPFAVAEPEECTTVVMNQWVLDVMLDYYLWVDEMPEADPEAFASPEEFVVALRSEPDRWTRVSDKVTSDALFMEGKFIGLGYKTSRAEDDSLRISFVSDNSPASAAGIRRGDTILEVGGTTVAEHDEAGTLTEAFGANEPGVDVELTIERIESGTIETLTLTKEWIDIVSLPVVTTFETTDGDVIGYFFMDKFVETTKAELDAAFASFEAAGVTKLIIDYRYNGGGLISVAERVVDLTVGAEHAGGIAYSFLYNDNYASENYSVDIVELESSIAATDVVFIVSETSRSATELVINALYPYTNVTLVGANTGGKPVGSKGFDFCDKKLFPITFRLVNAEGNTDYFEGLPADCLSTDDLDHQFGDPQETMLAAAIAVLDGGACTQPLPPDEGGLDIRHTAVGEQVLPDFEAREDIESW